ncbi:MAG: hypothetical protein ABSF72_11010 [Candidatus Sulfotelmatobacter sp.]|jgi:hypothetical protein
MSTADSKPAKIHEFSAAWLLEPGEHVLCAIVLGPDRDDPRRKTLRVRANAPVVELLRKMPSETTRMIVGIRTFSSLNSERCWRRLSTKEQDSQTARSCETSLIYGA